MNLLQNDSAAVVGDLAVHAVVLRRRRRPGPTGLRGGIRRLLGHRGPADCRPRPPRPPRTGGRSPTCPSPPAPSPSRLSSSAVKGRTLTAATWCTSGNLELTVPELAQIFTDLAPLQSPPPGRARHRHLERSAAPDAESRAWSAFRRRAMPSPPRERPAHGGYHRPGVALREQSRPPRPSGTPT